MKNKNSVLDTNVLIYLHDQSDPHKRQVTKELLADNPKIPAQVVSEYLNTCRRLLKLSKAELLIQTAELLTDCVIIPMLPDTLRYAADLVSR